MQNWWLDCTSRKKSRFESTTVWHGSMASMLPSAGRSRQMNEGAARATGTTLLFLHADTVLPDGYSEGIAAALKLPEVSAGAFRFEIDGSLPGKSLVEWGTNLRSRWLQMPYGDQGLFLRRSLFEQLGGFADMPIMEDYEFVDE